MVFYYQESHFHDVAKQLHMDNISYTLGIQAKWTEGLCWDILTKVLLQMMPRLAQTIEGTLPYRVLHLTM